MQCCTRHLVAASALILVISGCTPNTEHPSTENTHGTNSAAAQQNLPDCASIKVADDRASADQHIQCALKVTPQLTLDVANNPAWSFVLHGPGAGAQHFTEQVHNPVGTLPMLIDIDHSGTPALVVVNDRGGTGGDPMAIWKLTGTPAQFVRAGQMFGGRRFYRSAEGLFGNYSHSSASSGDVTLYRWAGDKLSPAADVEVQLAGRPPMPGEQPQKWISNGKVECTVNTQDDSAHGGMSWPSALHAAGLDPATAASQLCTQPWVATIYQ